MLRLYDFVDIGVLVIRLTATVSLATENRLEFINKFLQSEEMYIVRDLIWNSSPLPDFEYCSPPPNQEPALTWRTFRQSGKECFWGGDPLVLNMGRHMEKNASTMVWHWYVVRVRVTWKESKPTGKGKGGDGDFYTFRDLGFHGHISTETCIRPTAHLWVHAS